jgi:hypothetical protein
MMSSFASTTPSSWALGIGFCGCIFGTERGDGGDLSFKASVY